MSLERVFELVQGVRSAATADAAFGPPQEANGRVFIPVASVVTGFGLGFDRATLEPEAESEIPWDVEESVRPEDEETVEGGGGGGAHSHPVAVIEVTPEETIIRPILDETRVAIAGILLGAWTVFWLLTTIRAVVCSDS